MHFSLYSRGSLGPAGLRRHEGAAAAEISVELLMAPRQVVPLSSLVLYLFFFLLLLDGNDSETLRESFGHCGDSGSSRISALMSHELTQAVHRLHLYSLGFLLLPSRPELFSP